MYQILQSDVCLIYFDRFGHICYGYVSQQYTYSTSFGVTASFVALSADPFGVSLLAAFG